MKRFKRLLITMLALTVPLALVTTGCQQLPTAPNTSQPTVQIRPVPINPEYLGLAKLAQSDTSYVTVEEGGVLGGYFQTDNNLVVLPPNTLTENLYLAFSLVYVDDPADSLYGALGFSVSSFQNSAGDGASNHVVFKSGASATLYVNKAWLSGIPNGVMNIETGEVVIGVTDDGSYWKINVPHFSKWAWIW